MQYVAVIVVAAASFGLCYLIDKVFTKLFRSRTQHQSGLAVRLNKRYAVVGVVMAMLGIAAIISGTANGLTLVIAGGVLVLAGAALIVYHMTFGIYYDEDTFLLTTFGKPSATYQFRDIQTQQTYLVQGGNVIVELQLRDGRTVSIQSAMEGAYPFLDHAFAAWCRQTGRDPESCGFHNPSQSLWFPTEEDT